MFGTKNVYAMVTGFQVRVKDEREKDRNHLIETTFEMALTPALADEVLPAMVQDLFKEDGQPREELAEAAFNLTPDPQLLEIRNHPDLDPEVKMSGVTIRKIRTKKADGGAWLLVFTCTWVLSEPSAAIVMIQRLKLGVYLSFQVQEPRLDLQPPDGAAADAQAEPDQAADPDQGNLTLVKGKKGKLGRTRKDKAATSEEVQVKHCQECGAEMPAAATHCPQCGERFIDPPTNDSQGDTTAATDDGPAAS